MRRNVKFIGVISSLAILASCAAPVFAQNATQCLTHTIMVSRLAEQYGEVRQSVAISSNNTLVETFVSEDTGTWTILLTNPEGVACIGAWGTAYEAVQEGLPDINEQL